MAFAVKVLAAYMLFFSQLVAAMCEEDRLASIGRSSVMYDHVRDVPKEDWNGKDTVIIVNNMPKPSAAWVQHTAAHIVLKPLLEGRLGYTYEAALMLMWAEKESNYKDEAIGDSGMSHCSMQIYLPNNGHTKEGYDGERLRKDPETCIWVARRLMMDSFAADPDHPMATYAGDKTLADKRMQMVKKIVAELPSIDGLQAFVEATAWIPELPYTDLQD